MTGRERVKWVDVAKFFGMFAIYLGHFLEAAGNAYGFVYQFHVPLFFFLSGCMNNYDREKNLKKYVYKKTKALLVPLWICALLSLGYRFVMENGSLGDLKYMMIMLLKGCIRNTFLVWGLWFVSCLYVMDIAFKCIKTLKHRGYILALCLMMSLFSQMVLGLEPRMVYNIDSAMYYILYYAVGYAMYPYIQRLFQLDTGWKKGCFLVSGLICMGYGCFVYAGKDYPRNVFAALGIGQIIYPYIKAVLLIWMVLVVSKLLEGIELFGKMGKESLWLCGNEYLIKSVVLILLNLLGTELNLLTPMHACIYTIILMVFGVYVWIPMEKRVIEKVKNVFKDA